MTTAGVGPGGNWISAADVPQGAPGPDGSIYSGVLSGRPAASAVAYGATCWITFTSGGLTMRPVRMRATLDRTGTQVWAIDGRQVLYSEGGNDANPVRTFTAVAATGTIGTLGTIPGGLFTTEGMCLEVEVFFSRGSPAAATATFAVGMGGTGIAVFPTITANVDRVAWVSGLVWCRTASSQTCTYTVAPQAQGATGGSNANAAITATSDFAITADFSAATAADVFQVSAFTVWIQ